MDVGDIFVNINYAECKDNFRLRDGNMGDVPLLMSAPSHAWTSLCNLDMGL